MSQHSTQPIQVRALVQLNSPFHAWGCVERLNVPEGEHIPKEQRFSTFVGKEYTFTPQGAVPRENIVEALRRSGLFEVLPDPVVEAEPDAEVISQP